MFNKRMYYYIYIIYIYIYIIYYIYIYIIYWILNVKHSGLNKFFKFLSLKIFRLVSSSLLLYSQHFSQYVFPPSSGVSCQTREPTQNLELNPLFNCSNSVNYFWIEVWSYSKYSLLFLLVVGIEPVTSRWFPPEAPSNQMPYPLWHVSLLDNSVCILGDS